MLKNTIVSAFVFAALLVSFQAGSAHASPLADAMKAMDHDLDCLSGDADTACDSNPAVIADLRGNAVKGQGLLQVTYQADPTKLADLNRFFASLGSALDLLEKAQAGGDQGQIAAQVTVIDGIRKQAHQEFKH